MNERGPGPSVARLFFALLPDEAARRACGETAARLGADHGATRVPALNYHVTLRFVGAITHAERDAMRRAADAVRAAAFVLEFDSLEYWNSARAVVLLASQAPKSLFELAAALDAAFVSSVRRALPLRAHVTLARNVAQPPVLPTVFAFRWRAQSFQLLQSELRADARVYTVVDTWPLLDKRETI